MTNFLSARKTSIGNDRGFVLLMRSISQLTNQPNHYPKTKPDVLQEPNSVPETRAKVSPNLYQVTSQPNHYPDTNFLSKNHDQPKF